MTIRLRFSAHYPAAAERWRRGKRGGEGVRERICMYIYKFHIHIRIGMYIYIFIYVYVYECIRICI